MEPERRVAIEVETACSAWRRATTRSSSVSTGSRPPTARRTTFAGAQLSVVDRDARRRSAGLGLGRLASAARDADAIAAGSRWTTSGCSRRTTSPGGCTRPSGSSCSAGRRRTCCSGAVTASRPRATVSARGDDSSDRRSDAPWRNVGVRPADRPRRRSPTAARRGGGVIVRRPRRSAARGRRALDGGPPRGRARPSRRGTAGQIRRHAGWRPDGLDASGVGPLPRSGDQPGRPGPVRSVGPRAPPAPTAVRYLDHRRSPPPATIAAMIERQPIDVRHGDGRRRRGGSPSLFTDEGYPAGPHATSSSASRASPRPTRRSSSPTATARSSGSSPSTRCRASSSRTGSSGSWPSSSTPASASAGVGRLLMEEAETARAGARGGLRRGDRRPPPARRPPPVRGAGLRRDGGGLSQEAALTTALTAALRAPSPRLPIDSRAHRCRRSRASASATRRSTSSTCRGSSRSPTGRRTPRLPRDAGRARRATSSAS